MQSLLTTVQSLTSLFRLVGTASKTIDSATKTAGLISFATLVCCDYVQMLPWISWFFWINPTGQAYDALVSNEFRDRTIPCVGPNLVPSGPKYESSPSVACIGVGGAPGQDGFITGEQYLSSQSYATTHIWRNIGIMWAYWLMFTCSALFAKSRWRPSSNMRRS
jgi:ABC-type multidrug transport system permease subunit